MAKQGGCVNASCRYCNLVILSSLVRIITLSLSERICFEIYLTHICVTTQDKILCLIRGLNVNYLTFEFQVIAYNYEYMLYLAPFYALHEGSDVRQMQFSRQSFYRYMQTN